MWRRELQVRTAELEHELAQAKTGYRQDMGTLATAQYYLLPKMAKVRADLDTARKAEGYFEKLLREAAVVRVPAALRG
jgi:hypothetical protein